MKYKIYTGIIIGILTITINSCSISKNQSNDKARHHESPEANLEIKSSIDDLQFVIKKIKESRCKVWVDNVDVSSSLDFRIDKVSDEYNNEVVSSSYKIQNNVVSFSGNSDHAIAIAVYEFMQEELSVRWLFPGRKGVFYPEKSSLNLINGLYTKNTSVLSRGIRNGVRGVPVMESKVRNTNLHDDNVPTIKEVNQWRRRMQMGGVKRITYGHAFVDWWSKYRMSHKEYFALNKYGVRGPEFENAKSISENSINISIKESHKVKMCVSNTDLHDRIISQYIENGKPNYINLCENDGPGIGFCRCKSCVSLDVIENDEAFGTHLTDRYIFFANQIALRAKKYNPNVLVSMYAYNETETPPRKFEVDPNVLVVIVPTVFSRNGVEELFENWKSKGAQHFAFRPNYHHYFMTGAIPIGIEKDMYDIAEVAIDYKAYKLDFDCLMHNWAYNGLSDYILARKMANPSKLFDELEDEYFYSFGEASTYLKQYYKYWRLEVYNKRIRNHVDLIQEKGKYHNFMRGLMWNLGDYYEVSDFDKSYHYLKKSLALAKTENQTFFVESLMAAHEHAKLIVESVISNDEIEKYSKLHSFREKNTSLLNMDLKRIIGYENYWGDITKRKKSSIYRKSKGSVVETPLFWKFKLDDKKEGISQKWQNDTKGWDIIRTDNYVQKPHRAKDYLSPKLIKKLSKYEKGIWYSTKIEIPTNLISKPLKLLCSGIKGSGILFINGKAIDEFDSNGEIIFDLKSHFDKNLKRQEITIALFKIGEKGGIYDRIVIIE